MVRGQKGDKVKTVISLIRLRHVNLACYLHSHGKQLPKWLVRPVLLGNRVHDYAEIVIIQSMYLH